ncbi:hypothetical protein SPRG_04266 [Saprolegnia parasitica CBS 223.65]|uniref:Peptidase A1 domain-containing protein n=1 Tax=Saprolegnia parasitica (strain CBS 223.65) TaxID=695850 RepID=A0A067CWG5_SAPPC|nr:hypothetical protein SPRG_04266 [Saprolegnia parasitica CBS 223.65]KDO31127.1 hypothetical protein SPRG_04266 [Saprolegnia parasitica CBS 223.65]|eukprot:XP_012198256.1 hypothetical protein SPRG_04266 [Saprolegnia parasitica CBS 223.65]
MHGWWTLAALLVASAHAAIVWSSSANITTIVYPTYTYPDNLDLSKSFPLSLARGQDLLLPMGPLHHALFPEAETKPTALGFSIATCSGTVQVSLLLADNSTQSLSMQASQCFTFLQEPTPSSPSLCPLYLGADELYYNINPHSIQGVLLMADDDVDAIAHVHITSSHVFPGYTSLLVDDGALAFALRMQDDNVTGVAEFSPAALVDLAAATHATCVNCSYSLLAVPIAANASVSTQAFGCLASTAIALQLAPNGPSDNSPNVTKDVSALGRLVPSSGWYTVYLAAQHVGPSQTMVYPPVKLYVAHPPLHLAVYLGLGLGVAGVLAAIMLARRRYRRRRRRGRDGTHRLSDDEVDGDRGEFVGLLSNTSVAASKHTMHAADVGDEGFDDDDDVLARYDEIEGHV